MGQTTGATNTQKTVMLSLAEGWMLRYVDLHGWCLFMPNRARPFARVKKRTVDEMTAKGWLTPGIATKGLGYRPAKELTTLGRKYADRLLKKSWASDDEWDPLDQRATTKEPTAPPEKSSIVIEPSLESPSPLRSHASIENSLRSEDADVHANGHGAHGPLAQRVHTHGSIATPDSADESGASDAMPINRHDDEPGEQPRFRLVA